MAAETFGKVGMFEADMIDNVDTTKISKRMVKLATPAAEGQSLPEQGTWHYNRKKQILKLRPEVKSLYGNNPWSAVLIVCVVTLHTSLAIATTWLPWWMSVLMIYTVGALNSFQSTVLAHDAAHGLVFANRSPLNKLFCIIAFMPFMVGPFAGYWLIEHMYHHNVVVDKCLRFGKPSNPVIKKFIICNLVMPVISIGLMVTGSVMFVYSMVHLALYSLGHRKAPLPAELALPPFKSFPQIINRWTLFNIAANWTYFLWLYYSYGWMPVLYLLFSSCVSNGLHPFGGRMVQEHYVYRKDQPTYSVYSPAALLTFNIGYHVEHHDFPLIPWNRLPQLRELAPEFYNSLHFYNSYTNVMKEYFTNHGIPIMQMFSDNPLTNTAS